MRVLIKRFILVILLTSSTPVLSVNLLSSCMMTMLADKYHCFTKIKQLPRQERMNAKAKICTPKIIKSFNHCLKKAMKDKRHHGPCSSALKKKNKLKPYKPNLGLSSCFGNAVGALNACQKKIMHTRRALRESIYKSCAKEQKRLFDSCINDHRKRVIYLPPKEINLIDNIDNDCHIPKKYQIANQHYQQRLVISKAIFYHADILNRLEERLKKGKDNTKLNSLTALGIKTIKNKNGLKGISLKGGTVAFHFNRDILGKAFSLQLTPRVNAKLKTQPWRCSVNGDIDIHALPEGCQGSH